VNITGNARFLTTEDFIEKAVFSLLKKRDYDDFTIKEICKEAAINRSSFYAHYSDINDLMIKIEEKLARKLNEIWKPTDNYDENVFIPFFEFIKEYKVFYKAFAKSNSPSFAAPDMLKKQKDRFKQIIFGNINYSDTEIDYHLYYFGGGLKAICGLWLQNDCKESPEEMAKIIHDEYANNAKYFK